MAAPTQHVRFTNMRVEGVRTKLEVCADQSVFIDCCELVVHGNGNIFIHCASVCVDGAKNRLTNCAHVEARGNENSIAWCLIGSVYGTGCTLSNIGSADVAFLVSGDDNAISKAGVLDLVGHRNEVRGCTAAKIVGDDNRVMALRGIEATGNGNILVAHGPEGDIHISDGTGNRGCATRAVSMPDRLLLSNSCFAIFPVRPDLPVTEEMPVNALPLPPAAAAPLPTPAAPSRATRKRRADGDAEAMRQPKRARTEGQQQRASEALSESQDCSVGELASVLARLATALPAGTVQ